MAYNMKRHVAGSTGGIQAPVFSSENDEFLFTALPVAASSWVLESIGFREIVNSTVEWDAQQCNVTPGDAAKSMILAMAMNAERPALENMNACFEHEPLNLYFTSVGDHLDLSPDMYARTLTRIHESGDEKLFSTVSAALRARFGIKTRALHSDTSSVSVEGAYDCYDDDGNTIVSVSDGVAVLDDTAVYITRGYSKDKRPDLKQFMLGDAVDDNGIPWVSQVLDGNTADSDWNAQCLELLKETLKEERIIYVADSKLVNDPLISTMMEDDIMFISRCPENFDDKLLERTLMGFDLDELTPMENLSSTRRATTRRIAGKDIRFKDHVLRAVLVETSTLEGKGEAAVKSARSGIEASINRFEKTYSCQDDAVKAFERFRKRHSKGIFDLTAEYHRDIVERRPVGRPKKDGSDILRSEIWTVEIHYEENPRRTESLRRRKNHIMLITNVPTPEADPEVGLSDENVVRFYSNEWKVEWTFKNKKRPVLVRRLYVKGPGRATALITMINIAYLVRAIIQLLLRRGVDSIPREDLPDLGRGSSKLQRNVTYDYFYEIGKRCFIRYDPAIHQCRFFNNSDDRKASAILSLMGIPKATLFSGGIPGE